MKAQETIKERESKRLITKAVFIAEKYREYHKILDESLLKKLDDIIKRDNLEEVGQREIIIDFYTKTPLEYNIDGKKIRTTDTVTVEAIAYVK